MQECITGLKDKLNDKLSKQRQSDQKIQREMLEKQEVTNKLISENESLNLKLENEINENKQNKNKLIDIELQVFTHLHSTYIFFLLLIYLLFKIACFFLNLLSFVFFVIKIEFYI